jgi:hypothetical protein
MAIQPRILSEGLDMKRIRLLVPVLGLVLALLPSSAIAITQTTYHESVLGVETGQPTACPAPAQAGTSLSSFAGFARGTLNGVFQIAVCHTALTPNATIVGGAFTFHNSSTTVTGSFADGTVSAESPSLIGSLCIQKYTVSGDLSSKTWTKIPGTFAGKLVHYGLLTGGSCNPVFFATISGTADFVA